MYVKRNTYILMGELKLNDDEMTLNIEWCWVRICLPYSAGIIVIVHIIDIVETLMFIQDHKLNE